MNTPSTSALKRPRAAMFENVESPNGSFSAIRRRSIFASTPFVPQPSTSAAIQVINDDEEERRNLQRMSIISNISERERPRSIPSETVQEFMGNWLRMATENKINSKNVWKIHIIDYLTSLLDQKVPNPLIVASSAISASAKVYGLRVDDVYAKVLKLCGDLGRRNPAEDPENNSDQDDDGLGNADNPNPEQGPKRKAKKKNKKCVLAAPESLSLGELDQIFTEPALIAELHARGGDAYAPENLFQAYMEIDSPTSNYQIMEWDKTFSTDPPQAYRNMNREKQKCVLKLLPPEEISELVICEEFSNFSMLDWSLDKEGANLPVEMQPPTANEINAAFDMEAEIMPILDDSLTQPMVNGNDNFYSDEEAVVEEAEENQDNQGATRPRIHTVEVMRPGGVNGTRDLEYSYKTNYENDIWAGPAYWKIKSIQCKIKARVPVETESVPKLTRKRVTKQVILTYDEPANENIRSSVNKVKLSHSTLTTWSSNAKKNILPEDLHIKAYDKMTLFLKPTIKILPPERPASILSAGNIEYNYENLNDSTFCNALTEAIDQDDLHSISDQEDNHGPEDLPVMDNNAEIISDEMFADANMLAAPRVITKTFIPYAQRAKKVDMKRIKTAMWNTIIGENNQNHAEASMDISLASQAEETIVDFDPIPFTEVCQGMTKLLPTDQASNLSPGLAFFALLHLANEHSLELIGQDDLSNVTIKKC